MSDSEQKKQTLSMDQNVQIWKKLDDGVHANQPALDFKVSELARWYIKSH